MRMLDELALWGEQLDELEIPGRGGAADAGGAAGAAGALSDDAVGAVDGHVHSLTMSPARDLRPDTVVSAVTDPPAQGGRDSGVTAPSRGRRGGGGHAGRVNHR